MAGADAYPNDFKLLVLEELHRALEIGLSGASDRQKNLLSYLVTEELEGRGKRLKAYAIATQVLDRPDSFDAQQDSIVRVEIGRLRRALEFHYLTAGAEAAIAITIPKGQYRPVFTRPALALPAPDPAALNPYPFSRLRLLALAAAAAALLVAAIGAAMFFRSPPPPSKTALSNRAPVVGVTPFEFSSDKANLFYVADGLQAELTAALSEFEWLTVVPLAADPLRPERQDAAQVPDFLTRVSQRLLGDRLLTTALLLDGPTGAVRWTRHYSVRFHADEVEAMQRDLAAKIAVDVGHPFGIVANIERLRAQAGSDPSDEEFACQLQAYHYWNTLKTSDYADAADCFEKIGDKRRLDPDSLAARSLLVLDRVNGRLRGAARETALAEARRLADQAFAAQGFRLLPRVARYSAALCAGEIDKFREGARRVAHDYPNHPLVLVDVGAKLTLGSNDSGEGLPLIERARTLSKDLLVTEIVAPAVEALRKGDFSVVDRLRKSAFEADSLAAMLLQAALAAARNDPRETSEAKARLAEAGLPDRKAALSAVENLCWSRETRRLVARYVEMAFADSAAAHGK